MSAQRLPPKFIQSRPRWLRITVVCFALLVTVVVIVPLLVTAYAYAFRIEDCEPSSASEVRFVCTDLGRLALMLAGIAVGLPIAGAWGNFLRSGDRIHVIWGRFLLVTNAKIALAYCPVGSTEIRGAALGAQSAGIIIGFTCAWILGWLLPEPKRDAVAVRDTAADCNSARQNGIAQTAHRTPGNAIDVRDKSPHRLRICAQITRAERKRKGSLPYTPSSYHEECQEFDLIYIMRTIGYLGYCG